MTFSPLGVVVLAQPIVVSFCTSLSSIPDVWTRPSKDPRNPFPAAFLFFSVFYSTSLEVCLSPSQFSAVFLVRESTGLCHGSLAHPWTTLGHWLSNGATLFTLPPFLLRCGGWNAALHTLSLVLCHCYIPAHLTSSCISGIFASSLLIFTILNTVVWYFLSLLFPCVSSLCLFKTTTL